MVVPRLQALVSLQETSVTRKGLPEVSVPFLELGERHLCLRNHSPRAIDGGPETPPGGLPAPRLEIEEPQRAQRLGVPGLKLEALLGGRSGPPWILQPVVSYREIGVKRCQTPRVRIGGDLLIPAHRILVPPQRQGDIPQGPTRNPDALRGRSTDRGVEKPGGIREPVLLHRLPRPCEKRCLRRVVLPPRGSLRPRSEHRPVELVGPEAGFPDPRVFRASWELLRGWPRPAAQDDPQGGESGEEGGRGRRRKAQKLMKSGTEGRLLPHGAPSVRGAAADGKARRPGAVKQTLGRRR